MGYILLTVLEKTVDGLVLLEDFTYNNYKYAYGSPNLKKSAISMAIKRLKERGYIEKDLNEGKAILKITSLGRDYLKEDNQEWDGQYRIVIWDIPEKKRTIRNLLRRRLKSWGFKQWQKSVWISKKNVTSRLRELISEIGVDKMVMVIESNDTTLANIQIDDRP